jgi:hypothetical protein
MPTLHKPVFAKPKVGLNIRKEDGQFLPEGGDTVIHSTYWARREQDGDVTLSDDLPVDAPETLKKSAKPANNLAAVASTETK